ncbi:MAG: transposase, partial [Hellea sp.]|nr:transposase [Hellea sp.]
MPEYRRLYHPGGTYFFTVNLLDRSQTFLTDRNEDLMACFESVNAEHPFEMLAYAVMPEHLHCIWILPEGDSDFSTRWKKIKGRFTRCIPRSADTQKGRRAGERGIWQRRFWEHLIRDD